MINSSQQPGGRQRGREGGDIEKEGGGRRRERGGKDLKAYIDSKITALSFISLLAEAH